MTKKEGKPQPEKISKKKENHKTKRHADVT